MKIGFSRSFGSGAVALLAALSSTALVGCGSTEAGPNDKAGILSVGMYLGDGLGINRVDVLVSGNGIAPLRGSMDVNDASALVTTSIPGIPEGVGYTVTLHAASSDGATTCDGSSAFDIAAGTSTHASVLLTCAGPATGSLVVDGILCPQLTSFSATPMTAVVGQSVTVAAMARDFDTTDDVTPTFLWSATSGSFASTSSATTTYTCAAAGTQTLTIKVSATSPTRSVGGCDVHGTATVTCTAPVCGNNVVEPGEQCDPPNGTTCSSSCQTITAFCGDGVVNAPGEQCEPAGTAATPYAAGCDASCHTSAPLCGTCEASKCDDLFGGPGAWGCAGLTGAARTSCDALLGCIRTTHCAAATRDAQACYCGSVSDLTCLTGGGNGACKAQYEAAAGTTDPGTIIGVFTDPASPVGLVDNEITCDADTSAPSCLASCPL